MRRGYETDGFRVISLDKGSSPRVPAANRSPPQPVGPKARAKLPHCTPRPPTHTAPWRSLAAPLGCAPLHTLAASFMRSSARLSLGFSNPWRSENLPPHTGGCGTVTAGANKVQRVSCWRREPLQERAGAVLTWLVVHPHQVPPPHNHHVMCHPPHASNPANTRCGTQRLTW